MLVDRLNQVLAARRSRAQPPLRRRTLVTSLVLHAAGLLLLVLGPVLFADPPRPQRFVEVRVVPASALRAPRRTAAPAARPQPPEAKPKEVIEPEPPPRSQPVLASREAKQTPAPAPPDPAPAADQTAAAPPALGAASSTAITGFDTPFPYQYYVDRMVALIRSQWRRPLVNGPIELQVHFVIARDGTVSAVEVRSPSGSSAFDMAGLRAVEGASPLPPLPRSYREPTLGVTVVMH